MAFLVICAVRDSAIDAFGQPMFARALGEATRSFVAVVNDPTHPIGQHYTDYELFHLGTYNDADASMALHPPVSLMTGKAAFRKNEE